MSAIRFSRLRFRDGSFRDFSQSRLTWDSNFVTVWTVKHDDRGILIDDYPIISYPVGLIESMEHTAL